MRIQIYDIGGGALEEVILPDTTFEGTTGWTYSESGTNLTATDVGNIGAIVYISQDFYATGDFEAACSFSWDSAGTNTAMQAFSLQLYGGETRVATADYQDPWYYHRAEKGAWIGSDYIGTGEYSLPHAGSATVRIERIADMITVYWDDSILLTRNNTDIVDKLLIGFRRSTWPIGVFGSFSVDYVSASSVELESLTIVGADEVAESSQVQYKAIAVYDNNSTADVTASADWSVEPNDIASITAGLLTTEMVDLPTDVTIKAQYGEGPNTVEDEKQVSIFAICPSGSALEFDGVDDWVDLTGFNLGEQFSISLWVNPSRTDRGRCFIGKHTLDGINIFVLGVWDNGYHARIRDDWYTSGTPTTGWQHIAVVVEQLSPSTSNVTVHKDGEVLWQKILNDVVGDMSGLPWTIGQDWDHRGPNKTDFFNGLIDEVVIFNMALSTEEIRELMHTRPDINEPNLVAYWDFDEGSGQVATDLAGGNDGQLGDTNTPDSSDPNWVDSDAPIGICAMAELFERNINQAINLKLEMLDMLEEALGKEAVGEYILEQFLNDSDSNTWKKRDILESKRMVRSAVQNEKKAEINIEQSIDKLDDAMDTLGIE